MILPEDGSDPPESLETEGALEELISDDADDIISPTDITGGRRETLPDLLAAADRNGGASSWLEEEMPHAELLKQGKEKYGIDFRTDLNDAQIVQFARARIMAEHFKIPKLAEFVEHLERLSVSRNRKGRKEFVDTLKSHQGPMEGQMTPSQAMQEKLRS